MGGTQTVKGGSAMGGAYTYTGGITPLSGGRAQGGATTLSGGSTPATGGLSTGGSGTGGTVSTGGQVGTGGTTSGGVPLTGGQLGTGGLSKSGGSDAGVDTPSLTGGATATGGQTGGGGAPDAAMATGGAATGGVTVPAPTTFDNPIIKYDATDPTNGPGSTIFTADGAALVWKNKVYLYTGHDEATETATGYRMFDFRLWVSSDMVKWENKGVFASYKTWAWARGSTSGTGNANAAQVFQRDDKNGNPKFYFYAPVEGGQTDYGISIGVAVADKPEGPFTDPRGVPLIYLADTAGTATHAWRNLDPTVLTDDSGQAYLYWGNGKVYWTKLEDDMIHLKGETYSADASGKITNRSLGTAKINVISNLTNYTEAPFLHKYGSTYYLSYASGFPETISYATSTSLEGPWQYKGVIVDRVTNSDTVHQSIFEFQGAHYVTYHNGALPTGGPYRRSTCVDRLYYNTDGTIKKVVQTKK